MRKFDPILKNDTTKNWEKAVNYIAKKINKYKKDDDEEITEKNLSEIKAKLQKNLRAYPSYYRGYETKLR